MKFDYLQKYIKYKNKYRDIIGGAETPPSYTDVSKTSTDAFIYSLGFTKSQIDYAKRFPKYDIFIKHLIYMVSQVNSDKPVRFLLLRLVKQQLHLVSPLLSLLPINITPEGDSSLTDILTKHGFIYDINNLIGEGSFGNIYPDSSGQWTIKINSTPHMWLYKSNFVSHDDKIPQSIESFIDIVREMSYIYLFNKYKIGPQIPPPRKDMQENSNAFFMDFMNGETAIITKRYTGDLGRCLTEIKKISVYYKLKSYEIIEKRLKNILSIMLNELHIFCSDMKPENFLADWRLHSQNYQVKVEIQDIVATDFGGDWCCNMIRNPICPFLEKNKDLLAGLGRNYLLILQYLSICVTSYTYYNAILFIDDMILLNDYCNTPEFGQFLEKLCDSLTGCELVEPPFFYLDKCNKLLGLESPKDTNISKIITFLTFFIKKT